MLSNFEFLKSEFPDFAKSGISAETKLYDSPEDSIKDIGLMCEKMVIYICDSYGIEVDQRMGPAQVRIDVLKKEGIISSEQAKALHLIRTKRNKAVHKGEGSTDDCLELLPLAYEFAGWFANTFGTKNYTLGKYIIPDPALSKKGDVYIVDTPTNEHDVEIAKIKNKKEKNKGCLKVIKWLIFLYLILMVILLVVTGIGSYFEEKSSERSQKEFSSAVSEAQSLIDEKKYDEAEKAIDTIWPTPSIPVDIDDEDGKLREKLLVELEEGKAKSKGQTVPVCSMPRSSKSFKGDNYKDVAMELYDSGFVQIYSSRTDQDASLIHKKNTVKRISIDGTSEFDEGDQYSKTVKIIIYYYL